MAFSSNADDKVAYITDAFSGESPFADASQWTRVICESVSGNGGSSGAASQVAASTSVYNTAVDHMMFRRGSDGVAVKSTALVPLFESSQRPIGSDHHGLFAELVHESSGASLRVLTVNIWQLRSVCQECMPGPFPARTSRASCVSEHGEGAWKYTCTGYFEEARSVPDVIFIQELPVEGGSEAEMARTLGDAFGEPFTFFPHESCVASSTDDDEPWPDRGMVGVAVREPVVKDGSVCLAGSVPFKGGKRQPSAARESKYAGDMKGIIGVMWSPQRSSSRGENFVLAGGHLWGGGGSDEGLDQLHPGIRPTHIKFAIDFFQEQNPAPRLRAPVLLFVGDFNCQHPGDMAGSFAHRRQNFLSYARHKRVRLAHAGGGGVSSHHTPTESAKTDFHDESSRLDFWKRG